MKIAYACRTTQPQTTILLGGRKGFLKSATLDDGKKLPILESTDDGFAILIETPGDHRVTLELFAPITARGTSPKTEVGFEIGLPRAAVTTLTLDPLKLEPTRADAKVVNLSVRIPEAAGGPRPAEPKRFAIDIKQLTPKPGSDSGYPLGAVETLEATWEPPAASVQAVDQVQTAEFDPIVVLFTEAAVETTARIKLHGPARDWKIIAPVNAEMRADRANPAAEAGPIPAPVPTKSDANKPVWKLSIPAGTTANDWVVTAVVRLPRPKADDPRHRGPYPIGPFAVLDVQRQTGAVRVTAGPNTRFAFKHGADLWQTPVPGQPEDDVTMASFRLATGPTGDFHPEPARAATDRRSSAVCRERRRQAGIQVDAGETFTSWCVLANPGGNQGRPHSYQRGLARHRHTGGVDRRRFVDSRDRLVRTASRQCGVLGQSDPSRRTPTIFPLLKLQKKDFELTLKANVRIPAGAGDMAIPLLRFPGVEERETKVKVEVPEGQEIKQAEAFGRDSDSALNWGIPLAPIPATGGKPNKAVTAVAMPTTTTGVSRLVLRWNAAIPDLNAEILVNATLTDRQLEITEHIKLTSVDGLPKTVRFRPRHEGIAITGLAARLTPSTSGQFQSHGGSEWVFTPREAKEATLDFTYAIPLERRPADRAMWNIPVGVLWPVGVSRADATIRLMSRTTASLTLTNLSSGWRQLSTDPVPERDVIPALSLFGTGGELPLVIEARELLASTTTAVWVDSSLIRAHVGEDGVTRYIARFWLDKWLVPAVEVRLPGPLTGASPEFYQDGVRIANVASVLDSTERAFRVPLEPKTGKSVLEIRYQLPPAPEAIGEQVCSPPTLPNATFAKPIHWRVTVSSGVIPLLTGGAVPEFHWQLRLFGFAPAPNRSVDSSDESNAEDPLYSDESLTARQPALAPVMLHRFSRVGFMVLCSVVAFFTTLIVSRMPVTAMAAAITALGLLIALGAILAPHPTAQAAGACQPGLAAAFLVLALLLAIKWYYRHRVTYLPSFARVHIEPSSAAIPQPASTRSRPSAVGSLGAAPVAPGG